MNPVSLVFTEGKSREFNGKRINGRVDAHTVQLKVGSAGKLAQMA